MVVGDTGWFVVLKRVILKSSSGAFFHRDGLAGVSIDVLQSEGRRLLYEEGGESGNPQPWHFLELIL